MELPLLNLFKAKKKLGKQMIDRRWRHERVTVKLKEEKHIYCDNVEVIIGWCYPQLYTYKKKRFFFQNPKKKKTK